MERPLLAAKHLTQDDITIERWPLLHCVISLRDRWSKEVLGVSQTDNLIASGDEFDFTLRLSAAELSRVLDLIRSGGLDFVYTYSYANATEYKGSVDLKGVKNAKVVASQRLQSREKGEIFQAEANEAVRHVIMSVERTARANHKDFLPQLNQPGQFDALFQRLFVDDGVINLAKLKKNEDERTAEMIAAYLRPRLVQVRESLGEDKKHVTIDETRDGKSETSTPPTLSIGVAIPLGKILPSIGISKSLGDPETKTNEILKRIEQATGTAWAKETNSESYRPHEIKKFKFQTGADQVEINEKNTVFLSVSQENGYLEDSPVPVTFTTKTTDLSTAASTKSVTVQLPLRSGAADTAPAP